MNNRPNQSGIRHLNASLSCETARATIAWACETFGERLSLLASMQDTVLLDLTLDVTEHVDVVFLDNGYHFAETLQMVERVERHYGISVRRVGPITPPVDHPRSGECCDQKPALLDLALEGRDAWLSGIRRNETSNRATAGLIETDKRGLTKVNPLAGWLDEDVSTYIDARTVPTHPLLYQGYESIGCEPCTDPGESRDGRWAGEARVECGLHL